MYTNWDEYTLANSIHDMLSQELKILPYSLHFMILLHQDDDQDIQPLVKHQKEEETLKTNKTWYLVAF